MNGPVRHIRQTVSVPYRWSYGDSLSEFFRRMRDEKRFVGRRCPKCRGVHVPPVDVCGRCFVVNDPEFVEVGPRGVLHSYTTVHLPFPGQPTEPPYIFAMIQLDGSDTLFTHLVGEAPEEALTLGMAVVPVWNDERRGTLADIRYFVPERGVPESGRPESAGSPETQASQAQEQRMNVTAKDVFQAMEKAFQPDQAGDWATTIQFEISGDGGGDWVVEIGGRACRVREGKADGPKATVKAAAETWVGMATGTVNPQMAFMMGKVKVSGNLADVMKISNPKIFPKDK